MSVRVQDVSSPSPIVSRLRHHDLAMTPSPRPGHTSSPSPGAEPLLTLCEHLDGLAEHAIARARLTLRDDIEHVQLELWECMPQIHPNMRSRIAAGMRDIVVSARRDDLGRVALTAAEVYRIAHREVPADQRETPLRVPLLNYAALKLMALARQRPCDWTAIEGVASEVHISWSRLAPAAGLRLTGVLARSVDRLADAVRAKKAGRLYAAARRLHHVAQLMAERTDQPRSAQI